ncbi:hypothetical protein LEN26_017058 [Aphanomyces euteiches]|nr:hypothetical protein LEN26_017058 [Aphanomyces euteiches]KAH9193506.1 hypothetical protein AeNC1_004508 [Aphanomyces euteiches]
MAHLAHSWICNLLSRDKMLLAVLLVVSIVVLVAGEDATDAAMGGDALPWVLGTLLVILIVTCFGVMCLRWYLHQRKLRLRELSSTTMTRSFSAVKTPVQNIPTLSERPSNRFIKFGRESNILCTDRSVAILEDGDHDAASIDLFTWKSIECGSRIHVRQSLVSELSSRSIADIASLGINMADSNPFVTLIPDSTRHV